MAKASPPKKEGQKRRHKAKESYSSYILKVLKEIHPELGISKRSMMIMNSFVQDTFEKIATEAAKLCRYTKKETLSTREVQSATRLVLPTDLSKHATTEGSKSVAQFSGNKA
ncbi:MAG: hypothetical protein KVP17_001354 [Porospora cf. gigantea B]|uniref:uncharacterized protein n=1 Tax=Porospora cf. gigantea B TaxID=2853592 RepID=UPI003571D05F|nr:MAG: hypothetical protein KVP17_001354 [Porospora cf. gigantea B]